MILPAKSDRWPRMARVRQNLFRARLSDPDLADAARAAVRALALRDRVRPGGSVAVSCGSRGIDRIDRVFGEIVAELKAEGFAPFLFPAMGSHGGATAEGQLEVLAGLGITEASMGCPIRSAMEVVRFGALPAGLEVFLDRHAAGADAILAVNRIKPHTNFRGRWESGLVKMIAIGMGKHAQAIAIHQWGVVGLRDHMPDVARRILERAPVAGGIALLEDACHGLARIEGIPAGALFEREAALLEEVRAWSPKLPAEEIDLLVVGRIGKDLSGTGMDTNVIGRVRLVDNPHFGTPRIRVIVACDLSELTHGNATGVGMADLITRQLADRIDPHSTATNSLTGLGPQQAAIPVALENERAAVRTALDYLVGPVPPERARVIRIPDTLHLEEIEVSEPLLETLRDTPGIEVIAEPEPMRFAE